MGLLPRRGRWAKWVRCSMCETDVPAKVVQSPGGAQVTVIYCSRCDTSRGEKRDPRA